MKIINNKKIFIIMIILLLFCNFIFPNISFAEAGKVTWNGDYIATGAIQDVLDSMRNSGNNSLKTIRDKVGYSETKMNELKETVKGKLRKKFPGLEEDMYEKIYNYKYYRYDKNMIEVTCNMGGSSVNGYFITSFTVNFGSGLTLAKIKQDLEGKTEQEIGKAETDSGYLPPSSAATGQDPSGSITIESGGGSESSGGSSITGGGTTGGGPQGIGTELPELGLFQPTLTAGEVSNTTAKIGKILGVLRTLGAIMTVVSIAIIGFSAILGSASEKAEYQQKLTGVIIAGIFLVASTSIAKLIMDIAVTM